MARRPGDDHLDLVPARAHPLLRFGALRKPSFRVSNVGGSVYRMVISAAPFLLPLMFQVGFGWSPVLAGVWC